MHALGDGHNITAHYFGGPQAFYDSLMAAGFFNRSCSICHKRTIRFLYGTEQFPRTYCNSCHKVVQSCNRGSFFEVNGIKDIPAFFFILECFILNVSVEATTILSGCDPKTTGKYLDVARNVINKRVEMEYNHFEGSF